MAFDQSFLVALLLLIIGSGLLKGNISAQVATLYPVAAKSLRERGCVRVRLARALEDTGSFRSVVQAGSGVATLGRFVNVIGGMKVRSGGVAGASGSGFGLLLPKR